MIPEINICTGPTEQDSGSLVSVIIVTFNPRRDLLDWALDSVEKQTLPKASFEVIIVDNNSNPPLDIDKLINGRTFNAKLIQEPRQGIMFARCAGITESRSDLLVFVDDDNHLDLDYVEQALNISRNHQNIGAYSGIARGVFECPVRPWQKKLVPHLGVRDNGPDPITSCEPRWGEWDPIGAGMVLRRDIGMRFVEFVEKSPHARLLGRSGKALMSGDDTLIARFANQMGYACSYQPALKLSHHMKKSRLNIKNLARTIKGHGRSYVILQRILDHPVEKPTVVTTVKTLAERLLYRVKMNGLIAGFVDWFWDWGYFFQAWKETESSK